jgi:hypothetical protein
VRLESCAFYFFSSSVVLEHKKNSVVEQLSLLALQITKSLHRYFVLFIYFRLDVCELAFLSRPIRKGAVCSMSVNSEHSGEGLRGKGDDDNLERMIDEFAADHRDEGRQVIFDWSIASFKRAAS